MFDTKTESELRRLLEKLCEERLEKADVRRLERIVLADRRARRYYLDYVSLHGSLHWDAAVNNASDSALTLPRIFAATNGDVDVPEAATAPVPTASAAPTIEIDTSERPRRRRASWLAPAVTAAVLLVAAIVGMLALRTPDDSKNVAENEEPGREHLTDPDDRPRRPIPPLDLGVDDPEVVEVDQPGPGNPERPADPPLPPEGSTDETIVAFIDRQLEAGYAGAEVEPSPRADDAEWVRRVYLDLVGHIPPQEEVERFLADEDPEARAKLVQRLLDDTGHARHFASVWTNLLVGRRPSELVDRDALHTYLRESFAHNRPWSEVVTEIVAAEGPVDENGAANFLVAHVNNQAVPATAITARLFLGVQVQCTQCHEHPFNDWTQDQFWELNAFFKQTEVVRRRGRVILENEAVGGPTFYDTRQGTTMVAYPRYEGQAVDPAPETNRRRALTELLLEGDRPQVARAIVNRVWAHFMGRGFTSPIDDMGPHNPPTHPALLARLADEFTRSGYDLRRLITWVTSSSAYHRTSRFAAGNAIDAPETGEPPVFSRVYVRPMTPEQLYDSLIVATRGDAVDWTRTAADRDRWIREFVTPNETDENDETLALDGTIPQALAMMNGELVEEGTSFASGTTLADIATDRASTDRKIARAFLSTLSREPSEREREWLRERFASRKAQKAALGDLYWALLNSSEFTLVH